MQILGMELCRDYSLKGINGSHKNKGLYLCKRVRPAWCVSMYHTVDMSSVTTQQLQKGREKCDLKVNKILCTYWQILQFCYGD